MRSGGVPPPAVSAARRVAPVRRTARCDAEPGALFGSAGTVVPDGTGFMEVEGGSCAPDPVDDPERGAEADGEVAALPELSRWKNSASAAITASAGMKK